MRKPLLPALALSAALAVAGAAAAADFTAQIKDAKGETVGEAQLTDGPTGVLLQVEVKGLTPGWHAVHFHAKGDCGDPKFENASGHINHTPKRPHGLLNKDGPDMGDLPNLFVAADGSGKAEFFSTFVSLKAAGDRPALLDEDGSALVIHQKADDFRTQPIGGAGPRIACAVLKPGS